MNHFNCYSGFDWKVNLLINFLNVQYENKTKHNLQKINTSTAKFIEFYSLKKNTW